MGSAAVRYRGADEESVRSEGFGSPGGGSTAFGVARVHDVDWIIHRCAYKRCCGTDRWHVD